MTESPRSPSQKPQASPARPTSQGIKTPDHIIDRAVSLHLHDNLSTTQIAQRLGIGHVTAWRILDRAGVARHKPDNSARRASVLALHEAGLSRKQIQQELGLSDWQVGEDLRQQGVKGRISDEDCKRVVELYQSGMPIVGVSQKVGCSIPSVRKILKEAGVETRPKWTYREKPEWMRDEAVRLYTEERKSTTEIARLLNTNGASVGEWLKAAGKMRTQSQASSVAVAQGKQGSRSKKKYLWHSTKTGLWSVAYSLYEVARYQQLDDDSSVVHWRMCSERVPYFDPIKGVHRSYVPDIDCTLSDGSRRIEEVKPSKLTMTPANQAKMLAAQNYFAAQGASIVFVTEHDIGMDFINSIKLSGLNAITAEESRARKRQYLQDWHKAHPEKRAINRQKQNQRRAAMSESERQAYNQKARERKAERLANEPPEHRAARKAHEAGLRKIRRVRYRQQTEEPG